MTAFGNCLVCNNDFHYSDVSQLTVEMDMAGLDAPDVCMFCEQEIRNA